MDVIEKVDIRDEEGNTMDYSLYKGCSFPPHVVGNIRDLVANCAKLKCRQDDVLLYTYPKSGTHWMHNILHMFITGNFAYAGTASYLEFAKIDVIDNMPSPRLIATHLEVDLFPDDIKNVFFGNWYGALKQWLDIGKTYPKMKIFTLYYEDLKRNTLPNLKRVVNFLEIPRDEDFCKSVIDNTGFATMKRHHETESKHNEQFKDVVKDGVLPIYRKGEIGDWKRWFTPTQSELFDRVYKERLAKYDLDLVYE